MKKLALMLFALTCTPALATPVKLESKLLSFADGKFFIADTIEMLRKFQRRVMEILSGIQQGAKRVGKYTYNGKQYGSRDLARIEHEQGINTELHKLLQQIKTDFLVISKEFEEAVRGSKQMMIVLIEESCTKRNRLDSLLLTWSQTDEEHEAALFNREVTSLQKFDQFSIDLLNFFSDLIYSCPKAQQLFKDRLTKWKKFKTVLDAIKNKVNLKNENAFLKHVKIQYLDKMSLNDITESKIKQLLSSF